MQDLAVYGWNEDTPRVLTALYRHAGLCAVAVGDRSATLLVRAREATGVACYQHVHEMTRIVPCDVALLESADAAIEAAAGVASRGGDLVVRGDALDGEALTEAANGAARYGVSLAVLRPALQRAGINLLVDLLGTEPGWAPVYLGIEVRDERDPERALRDGLAVAARLTPAQPMQVTAAAGGLDLDTPSVLSAQLRFEHGALALIAATASDTPALRITASSAAGTATLEWADGRASFLVAAVGRATEALTALDGDLLSEEATRTAAVRRNRDQRDLLLAHREAATLRAVEAALSDGLAHRVEEAGLRSTLRVFAGGGHAAPPRAGHLHLLSV